MWYQQRHDILLQCQSGPQRFVSCFTKKLEKNEKERNNQWLTFDQWDLVPNQHQRTHGEQEETKQRRKVHERECPSGIEECTGQQHSEQTEAGSPGKQHRKCLDE